MIDSITAPSPEEVRAERRRLIESIRAIRRLLAERRSFEVSDQRRLNREARNRKRVEDAYLKALQRAHERRVRRERSLTRKLNGLDGKRERQEKQALAVLRRESIERSLRSTYLTEGQVNGIGKGLIRDLAAHGIRTAADFKRVSWGKAPNGKGGEVLYIHRTSGGKVHINGIGEHRGRPLEEWRRQALARAEARAPRELPPDQRHRIAEIIEAERRRLTHELEEVPREAEAARAEAEQRHREAVSELEAGEREAARRAAERRAEFDAMAEQLLALQAELSAHMEQYGELGFRVRRAQTRALRPLPSASPLSAIPSPRTAPESATTSRPKADPTMPTDRAEPAHTFGVRASLGWLVPILFFLMTAVFGMGDADTTAPLWLRIASRVVALAVVAELVRLWVPRRRVRTAAPMPKGSGPLTLGAFVSLIATSMFVDTDRSNNGAAWFWSVVAALLVVGGAVLRADKGKSDTPSP